MTQKNLILEIQAKFFEKLETKNSWGKNEVKGLYQAIQVEVLSEKITGLIEKEQRGAEKPFKFAERYGNIQTLNSAALSADFHKAVMDNDIQAYNNLPKNYQDLVNELRRPKEETNVHKYPRTPDEAIDEALPDYIFEDPAAGVTTASIEILRQQIRDAVAGDIQAWNTLPHSVKTILKEVIEGRAELCKNGLVKAIKHKYTPQVNPIKYPLKEDNVVKSEGDSEGVF